MQVLTPSYAIERIVELLIKGWDDWRVASTWRLLFLAVSLHMFTVHLFCVLGRAVWESEVESGAQTDSGDGGGGYVTKLELS